MSSINQWAGAIFVLPFLIFASSAGYLAGQVSKQRIVQHIKLVELVVMIGGTLAFLCTVCSGLLVVLFSWQLRVPFLACQIWNPSGAPALLGAQANGWQQAFVYMAIVLGAGMVPLLSRLADGKYHIASLFCVGISVLGWLLAKGIAPTQASGNTQAWHLNPLKGVTETYEKTRQDIPLITAIFGAAFFLLIGGFVQMNLIPYGVTYMGFEQMEDASLLFLFVAAGIGAGAMGAGLLSGRHIEFGLVPLGAIGLALTLGLLGLQVGSDHFTPPARFWL